MCVSSGIESLPLVLMRKSVPNFWYRHLPIVDSSSMAEEIEPYFAFKEKKLKTKLDAVIAIKQLGIPEPLGEM